MKKHVSWIIALIVGAAAGALVARTAGVSGTIGGKKLSDLPQGSLRETDLPTGTLAGLTESQKYQVLKGISDKYGQKAAPQRPVEDTKAVYKIPIDDSPVKGPANALVTIVESSDFQCPFCKRVIPTLKQIEQAYPGKVRFAFKHNPLGFHDKAMPAAIATEEARAQGKDAKFWAMHDKLFELAPSLDRASLERAGQEVGLNLAELRSALDSSRYGERIRRDQSLVTSLGAGGTPAFFINGRKLSGAQPFESFKTIIDEELKKAEEMVKSGTPAEQVYARIIEKGATAPVMIQGQGQGQGQPPPLPQPPPMASKVSIRPDDPSRGPKDAKVTVVLFSDFQCPFCSRIGPTMKQLEEAYGKDVRIVWKHQPLPFHPNAMPAAEAAEAAREQGKFWQMHDQLFAHQQELSPAKYEEWAGQIGLDSKKFKAAMESHRFRARIEEDAKLGQSVGANGTPTLYVNCRQIVGAQPFERFKAMVEEELKKAAALEKQGVKVDGAFYQRICEENVKSAGTTAKAPAEPTEPSGPVQIAIRPDDPVKGNAKAPVTIVEFSDFQCPFCSRAETTMNQVVKSYGDKVRVVWKHEPLPMHPNAVPAALAAEAAREQGKFWQMHEKLFANHTSLSSENYEKWAKELGLDMARFREALQSPKNKARVEEDAALGQRIGANGTPTFFVNGEKLVGAQPFERFKEIIDRQLAKAEKK